VPYLWRDFCFYFYMVPIWIWWSSIVFGCLYYALCSWCTSCYCCLVGLWYVFSRAWYKYDTVYLLMCRVGWACSSITVYAPSLLCGSSHLYWGLLLTCRVDERCVDVLCRGYGWFSEWINAVVGCSVSLLYVYRNLVVINMALTTYLTNINVLCTLSILYLLTWWNPTMHSILWTHLYKRAWRWPVYRSKHVAHYLKR
jgi:hypothetical protein